MPFIRYNLGDIAVPSSHPCACGRNLPLMSVIEGRSVDCVVLPDGTRMSPLYFLGKFDSIGEVALEYQVVQTAQDEFRITLVPRRELRAADRERVIGFIREQHPDARVSLVETGEIPRESSGKRRACICEV